MHWMQRVVAAIELVKLFNPFLPVGHCLDVPSAGLVGHHGIRPKKLFSH